MASRPEEASSKWVYEQMLAVLDSFSEDQVQRALPVLVMQMCGEFGYESLEPDFQAMMTRIAARIGLEDGLDPREMEHRVTTYVRELQVNPEILHGIHDVFERHRTALGESSAEDFQEKFDQRNTKTAPQVGEARPEGALAAEALSRAMTGKIKS